MRHIKPALLLLAFILLASCASKQSSSVSSRTDSSSAESSSTKSTHKETSTKSESIKESAAPTTAKVENKTSQTPAPSPSKASISNSTPQATPQVIEKNKQASSPIVSPVQTPVKNLPTNNTSGKGALKGKIALLDAEGKNLSAEGAIIELKKISSGASPAIGSKSHHIDTRSKVYIPGFMTVNVGDTLVFKNNDGIKHNVFSSSGKNTFDLGTYGYNREKDYQVAHEGIIKVYCNIHPEMALFISASKGSLSFITDSSGEYSFKDVEPGKYTLSVWHLRGTQEKTITIKEKITALENVNIDTSSYKPEPRVNKHGEAYKVKPAIFKDEFY